MGTGFRDLKVWRAAKELSVEIYKITSNGPFSRDYSLVDQLRRSSVSVPSNIAEGDERETDRESIRYLYIAKGSTAELLTQVIIAHEIGYLSKDTFNELEMKCLRISRMLSRLIASRSMKLNNTRSRN